MLNLGKGDFEDFEDELSDFVAVSSEGKATRAVPDLRMHFKPSLFPKLIASSSVRTTRDVYNVKGFGNRTQCLARANSRLFRTSDIWKTQKDGAGIQCPG